MNLTTNLIINIYRPGDPCLYTVTTEANQFVTGFSTIGQLDTWLKLNDGKFTSDPVEVQPGADVYQREAQISDLAYNRMIKAQEWAEKKAA